MAAFIEEIIDETVPLGQEEQNTWKRWLEHHKKSWGFISNISGYTMVV